MTPNQLRRSADELLIRAAEETDSGVREVLTRAATSLRKSAQPKIVRGSFRSAGGHAVSSATTSVSESEGK
ncbi:hypothetical protein [Magnetovibrio sp.]|uniref:hypothetical protein n=1 Tax=Magnetovibrio sp. TaxID=2024836 RepID=UPI002F94A95F